MATKPEYMSLQGTFQVQTTAKCDGLDMTKKPKLNSQEDLEGRWEERNRESLSIFLYLFPDWCNTFSNEILIDSFLLPLQ